jgi:luciferase family oxidoreductase group 1
MAIEDTLRLAEAAERAGYRRFWVAEHHVEDSSHACPELLVALLGTRTRRIRIGSGGVLLRYYSPLKVAETFLMLEALTPGRVDLGIAKGPGVVIARMAEALVDDNLWELHPATFERKAYDLSELLLSREGSTNRSSLQPPPTEVQPPPLWVLGSGPGSSALAARLRRPFATAMFFAGPKADASEPMIAFRRAVGDNPPETIVAVSVTSGETQAAARLRDAALVDRGKIPANVVGTPEACVARLVEVRERCGADEVMITTFIDDPTERLWLFDALAQAWAGASTALPTP